MLLLVGNLTFLLEIRFLLVSSNVFESLYCCLEKSDCKLMLVVSSIRVSAFFLILSFNIYIIYIIYIYIYYTLLTHLNIIYIHIYIYIYIYIIYIINISIYIYIYLYIYIYIYRIVLPRTHQCDSG